MGRAILNGILGALVLVGLEYTLFSFGSYSGGNFIVNVFLFVMLFAIVYSSISIARKSGVSSLGAGILSVFIFALLYAGWLYYLYDSEPLIVDEYISSQEDFFSEKGMNTTEIKIWKEGIIKEDVPFDFAKANFFLVLIGGLVMTGLLSFFNNRNLKDK